MMQIEVGKNYELNKRSRWGTKFRVRKITDKVVCGIYNGGYLSQGSCIKIEDFKEMIKK